jgi:guanylate kinase
VDGATIYSIKGDLKQRMEKRRGGLIFIVSAPSGAGKTTLIRRVMEKLSGLKFSVSYTTRHPRLNERNGEDYYFISHEEFQKKIERDEFLEWAEVLGNLYGTGKINLDKLESEGLDLILDIDSQGAKRVLKKIHNAILIYILPPSPESLKKRLEERGLDSKETISFRLANAKDEIKEAKWYHYVIVNDNIEDAVEKFKAIIVAERCRWEKEFIIEEKKRMWEGDYGKDYC